MKEYQQSIWNGINVVNVKKNMTKKVPPALPAINYLEWIKSAEMSVQGRIPCERCGGVGEAKHLVRAKFSGDREPLRFYLCTKHRDAFLGAFAPFVAD